MSQLKSIVAELAEISVSNSVTAEDRPLLFRIIAGANVLLAMAEENANPAARLAAADDDDDRPDSRGKALAAFEWAVHNVPGADGLPVEKLYRMLMDDYQALRESLPPTAESFARYLRQAGVKRRAPHVESRNVARAEAM